MSYIIDNQTYSDLNLIGRYRGNSIFSLFNHTVTRGASAMMEQAFASPFVTAADINKQRDIFISIGQISKKIPVKQRSIEAVDEYLSVSSYSSITLSLIETYRFKLASMIFTNNIFENGVKGIKMVQKLFKSIINFILEVKEVLPHGALLDRVNSVADFLLLPKIEAFTNDTIGQMGLVKIAQYNAMLRNTYRKRIVSTLRLIEELDFYLTVANIGKKNGYTYANAIESDSMCFEIDNMCHPTVPGAVGNDVKMDYRSNLMFLTGANMAGKSTFMKSLGISLYLAQLGFPLAADRMEFTPLDGLFTSINVPDDISKGYSHFYAEVMRVKGVAVEVAKKNRLLVIFDELFKGTNVKDAYDGTAAITTAFSCCDKSLFVISTHIMEVGELLKERCSNIQFKYLPTILDDNKPRYTYKLTDGVADDRYGLRIIHNEQIVEIINDAANSAD